jgi:Bardet-Biedl syndrome 9 protein
LLLTWLLACWLSGWFTGWVVDAERPELCAFVLHTAADAPADILVLAEHTFFVLNLRGQLLVQRRLDYHPACCWPFPAGPDSSSSSAASTTQQQQQRPPENLLVATHTKALMVYRGQELAWAARLEVVPVAVRVAALQGMQGMIVALDDTGARHL